MTRVEFEVTIPSFERAKTVQAVDGAATVTVLKTPPHLDSNPRRHYHVASHNDYGNDISGSI
jgi:hypothetical protein